MPDVGISQGWAGPSSFADERNASKFEIDRGIARTTPATLVQVIRAPYDASGNTILAGSPVPIGYVDVQPLVNQLDGFGNPMSHAVVFHCSYWRYQGGAGGIIVDPVVGDIGKFIVADRDTSAVKATNQRSNPGSLRRYNKADGTYFGATQGPLNGTSLTPPVQYVSFTENGIIWRDKSGNSFLSVSDTTINPPTASNPTQWAGFTVNGFEVHDKNGNTLIMNSSGVFINGAQITFPGDVISGPNHVHLDTHHHPQGADSAGDTEVDTGSPVPNT